MNWEAIGAVGELIGSVAVVLTIAYLAVQIRQSGKASISVSTNQSRSAVTDVIGAISSNTDAVNTYSQGLLDRDSLERHEKIRFDLIIFQQLRCIETIFLEYREGLLPKEFLKANGGGSKQY